MFAFHYSYYHREADIGEVAPVVQHERFAYLTQIAAKFRNISTARGRREAPHQSIKRTDAMQIVTRQFALAVA